MGDAEFRTFYEEHARRLWAYVARISGNRSAADDIVQEAFLRMLEMGQLETMTSDHRKNYLYKVAGNLVKRRFKDATQHELMDLPGPKAKEQIDEAIAVRNALNKMKTSEQTLLWLAYVEGFSHREIGTIAGYGENSVRPLLHRAKQKLLDLLGGGRGHRIEAP